MKIKLRCLSILFAALCLPFVLSAQTGPHDMIIPPFTGSNYLNDIITGDTLANGDRVDLERVYWLERDGTYLVFVEVRSRRSTRFGRAVETVAYRKQQRLLRSAAFYLQKHRLDLPCRFDIVGINRNSDSVQVEWVKDAFQAF